MEISIGLLLEVLHQLRIKVNADHVGHSLPLLLLKALSLSILKSQSVFLSNNLLTALVHTETKDAMEDGWIKPSITLKSTDLPPPVLIPTLLEINYAKLIQENTRSQDTSMFLDVIIFSLLFPVPPYQLLLMPATGEVIEVEFYLIVELLSTTESF